MPSNLPFSKHEKLLRKMAYQFHRRAIAAGAASLSVDDVFQEMCVAWCVAQDKYDPATQVPFTAYLVRGVRNHVNRWLGKEIWNGGPMSLDGKAGDEGDSEIHEIIADTLAVSPESAVIENDDRIHQRRSLSDDAQKFLEILENPHPALFQALEALRARREFAVARGIVSGGSPKKITASMVFDLMGFDKNARDRVSRELRAYSNMELLVNG